MKPHLVRGTGPTRRRLLGAALGSAAFAVGGLQQPARAASLVRPWPADKATPPLELNDLDGRPWDLAAAKGRPLLLNFWASWCEPCRAEMPSLEQLAARHRRDGLLVLSVNYLESPAVIKNFLARMPLSLPILLDHDGAAAAVWTPRVFPTTVLVDRGGTARQQVLGDMAWTGRPAADLMRPLLARAGRA